MATYKYDFAGRKVARIVGTTTTTYLYDGDQVIVEYENGSWKRRYYYGPGTCPPSVWRIDEPLLMNDGSNDYYYSQDHLYSSAGLLDSSGGVVERYEYDAYGQPYVLDANFADDADGLSDYNNPYMFTGREVDFLDNGNLKLQYNRNRYYDYYTGRWLTQDSFGFKYGYEGENLYEFMEGNPCAYKDESINLHWILDIDRLLSIKGKTDCTTINEKPTGGVYTKNWDYSQCTRPCTQRHEDVHVKQLKPICQKYLECWEEAKDRKERDKCTSVKIQWVIDNRDRCECEAWEESAKCAEDRRKERKCCSGKGKKDLEEYEKQIEKAKKRHKCN